MIGCLPTQAIAFEWKLGFKCVLNVTNLALHTTHCTAQTRALWSGRDKYVLDAYAMQLEAEMPNDSNMPVPLPAACAYIVNVIASAVYYCVIIFSARRYACTTVYKLKLGQSVRLSVFLSVCHNGVLC